jgi:hypothetical protein
MLRILYNNYYTYYYQNLPNNNKTSTSGTKPTPAIKPPIPLPFTVLFITSDGRNAINLSII